MAYVNLGQVMYPVGAYFFSNNSTSPSSLFGGTWAAVDAGRFICAAGSGYDAGAQGGASSVTLSAAQMPAHTHGMSRAITNNGTAQGYWLLQWGNTSKPNGNLFTDSAGNNEPHENRPLYRAAYIWRRTA